MMLRPATPLTALLAAAFALLLLSVLSTPIIRAIPLGQYKGTDFGVFGFCPADGSCSSISIGYDIGSMSNDHKDAFDLPASTRNTLSAILIVHPVAALMTLVLLIMSAASHLHAASHSARYLLIVVIFMGIDFLICLLAFIVDVLLFIPHMAWGSYITLASTVMVLVSLVMSFFMRKTLVSRKARRKRIAENAEMSGENYYNREAQSKATVGVASEPAPPMPTGSSVGGNDSLPAFASFENRRKDDQVSDERVPLTQQRTPVERSPHDAPIEMRNVGAATGMNSPRRSQSRDQWGNPVNGGPDEYGMTRGPSMESMNSRGRRPPPGYRGGRGGPRPGGPGGFDAYGRPMRGRGGHGPPGRGGYGPRGGRGGYGQPPRGAYGPGGMRGGRGPPPSGYGNVPVGAYGNYGQGLSEASLAQSTNPSSANGYDPYSTNSEAYPRAESPPPMQGSEHGASPHNRAIEMDATPAETPHEYGQYGQLRNSDSDVAGMVGMQQGQHPDRQDTYMTEGSKYSQDEQYMPPRAAWNQDAGSNSPRGPSPLHAEQQLHPGQHSDESHTPARSPSNSGHYYEDVEARFAGPSPSAYQTPPAEPIYEDVHANAGGTPFAGPSPSAYQTPPTEPTYEDVHASVGGARSPAGSERSNFTSISQRGVNPRWNPPPPMPHPYQGGGPPRRPGPQRQDMLLDMPDFQVPGGPSGSSRRGGPGMTPGSAYPTGPMP